MKPSYFRSIRFSIRMGINKGRSDAEGTEHLGDYLPRGSLKLPRFHPTMILKFEEWPSALSLCFIHLGLPAIPDFFLGPRHSIEVGGAAPARQR